MPQLTDPADAAPMVDRAVLLMIRRRVLRWFAATKRDLPWRRTADPYHVLVSEVMLQQTQASRVAPKFESFIRRFPTLESLAAAETADVIREWQGLGYNRRAVRLHAMAREMLRRWGRVPEDPADLLSLDGIGRYTAAAVASFAYGAQAAAVDTNVRRVLTRLFIGGGEVPRGRRWLEDLAHHVLPGGEAAAWNAALMDMGAGICTAARPRCEECPVADLCRARPLFEVNGGVRQVAERRAPYRVQGPYRGSTRYYRGRVVQALREAGGPLPFEALERQVLDGSDLPGGRSLAGLVRALEADGLVRVVKDGDGAVREVSLP